MPWMLQPKSYLQVIKPNFYNVAYRRVGAYKGMGLITSSNFFVPQVNMPGSMASFVRPAGVPAPVVVLAPQATSTVGNGGMGLITSSNFFVPQANQPGSMATFVPPAAIPVAVQAMSGMTGFRGLGQDPSSLETIQFPPQLNPAAVSWLMPAAPSTLQEMTQTGAWTPGMAVQAAQPNQTESLSPYFAQTFQGPATGPSNQVSLSSYYQAAGFPSSLAQSSTPPSTSQQQLLPWLVGGALVLALIGGRR